MTSLPQLSTNNKPLPLIVAEKYNFSLQFHIENGQHHYAILDWIAGISGETDSKKLSQMWDVFYKKQTSISDRTLKMDYIANDGKTYQRDFVRDEILYKFAAYARATKDRPILSVIKNYLAKAGAFTDKARMAENANGPSLENRKKSIEARKRFTDSYKNALIDSVIEGWKYSALTDKTYYGLFRKTAKNIRDMTNKEARDALTEQGLLIVMTVESTGEAKFRQYDHEIEHEFAMEIMAEICRAFHGSVVALQRILGYDLATGRTMPPQLRLEDYK